MDYPLNSQGIDQANRLAAFWKSNGLSFDLIISSPLQRAARTAEIIATQLKAPIQFDAAWKERHFGQLQGEPLERIKQYIPAVDFFHPYDPIGSDGESQLELYNRACMAIQNIVRQPAGAYLVVSHGGILNKALYAIMGITPQGHYNSPIFHFGNLAYAQLRYNSATRQWAVLSLNNHFKSERDEGLDFWTID